jgi:hypothetical protein
LHSRRFGCCVPVLFRLLLTRFALRFRLGRFGRENVWGRKDLVKMLELLTRLQSVLV